MQCETHCSVHSKTQWVGWEQWDLSRENQKIPLITHWENSIVLPGRNAYWKKKKEVFSPHYFFKVIHQCCLLLFTVNDWEYAFNRSTEKHTKPRFALEQRGAAACISASIHCFITAASRCFGPPFFHNLEMVLNVQMQMLLTILSLPLAAIHSFCQKYAEK